MQKGFGFLHDTGNHEQLWWHKKRSGASCRFAVRWYALMWRQSVLLNCSGEPLYNDYFVETLLYENLL